MGNDIVRPGTAPGRLLQELPAQLARLGNVLLAITGNGKCQGVANRVGLRGLPAQCSSQVLFTVGDLVRLVAIEGNKTAYFTDIEGRVVEDVPVEIASSIRVHRAFISLGDVDSHAESILDRGVLLNVLVCQALNLGWFDLGAVQGHDL